MSELPDRTLRLARFLLHAVSLFTPAGQRREWREEWLAELWHRRRLRQTWHRWRFADRVRFWWRAAAAARVRSLSAVCGLGLTAEGRHPRLRTTD